MKESIIKAKIRALKVEIGEILVSPDRHTPEKRKAYNKAKRQIASLKERLGAYQYPELL